MIEKQEAVVIFDSGVGGLTTLKEMNKFKINGPFVYLADTKNTPYGNKTKDEIIKFILDAFSDLEEYYSFHSIILACNTATAYTKKILKKKYNVEVYSVVDAATSFVNTLSITSTIDVLSTTLTKESNIYKKKLVKNYVKSIDCPPFVPFVESNDYFDKVKRKEVVFESLLGRCTENASHVLLGCTHYPLLQTEIQYLYGEQTEIIDPSYLLAKDLKQLFPKFKKDASFLKFYLTSNNANFNSFASALLGYDVYSNILEKNIQKNII